MIDVAYLISRYPAVSHTFILRETRALRALGLEVHPYTIRRPDTAEVLSDLDHDEQRRTTALLPTSIWRLFQSHSTTFLTSPLRYLRAGGMAITVRPPGFRSALWHLFYFAEAAILAAELRNRRIRHIHAHFANVAADVAMLTARLIGGSWSMTLHGESDFSNPLDNQLGRKIDDAAFVVCVSEFGRAQAMLRCRPDSWGKIRVIRTGVNPETFSPRKEDEHTIHFANPLRILTVGRLSPEKGQVFLLQALKALKDRRLAFRCTIVGDGPLRSRLIETVKSLGLADRVNFTGAVGQDKLHDHYRNADIFVLPSLSEGLPVVLMEAMACGLPIVASRITGIPELVSEGKHGLLVTPGKPETIADALQSLADDPSRRVAMGECAREFVCERFDIRVSAAELADVFKEYLPTGTAGAAATPAVTKAKAARA